MGDRPTDARPAAGRLRRCPPRRAVAVHAVALLAVLAGCATRAWVLTQSYNTLYAYEAFLSEHAGSDHAVEAWSRLDSILLAEAVVAADFDVYERFFVRYPVAQFGARRRMEARYAERARAIGCPFALEAYLGQFPDGAAAAAVRADAAAVQQHLRQLSAAVAAGLPTSTRFTVSRELGGPGVPEYVVAAALIPGRDLDDGNPGHYFSTAAALNRAVRDRCLGIVRAVAAAGALPSGAGLVVRVRQGVGLESMGFTSSFGRPMTIFEVAAPAPAFAPAAAGQRDDEVAAAWQVRQNLIPRLLSH